MNKETIIWDGKAELDLSDTKILPIEDLEPPDTIEINMSKFHDIDVDGKNIKASSYLKWIWWTC